ncbi:hypothetical protein BH10PSE4_BH10PSE4_15460 [soil metagenome]
MQAAAAIIQGLYLIAGLASLAAVIVLLYRLGYSRAVVAAPLAVTIVVVLGGQVLAFVTAGIPLFVFGFRAAVLPALMLIPPVFIVLIALSKRLSTRSAEAL